MLNTFIWMLQGVLAAFFLMAGSGKLTKSVEEHVEDRHIQPGQSVLPIRLLGVMELLGCVGIIVPWWSGIQPILTPVTACCFGGVMVGAVVIQARRRDYQMLAVPVVLLVLCAVVAWYRFNIWCG